MAATDARPVPQKGVAYRVTFPILDADGDLVTGATGLDSEVSKDAGTFADCTNEATEIATSSGMYYLDLTSTEMDADTVAIIVKTTSSGAKTTPIVLYPEEAGDIRVNVTAFGGTAGTFASGRPEVNTTHWGGTAVASAVVGANVAQISGDATAADNLEAALDGTGGVTITAALTGNITGNLSGSVGSVTGAVGSVTGAVGSVTGNVGGNVAGSVGSVTAGVTVTTNNDKTGYTLSATGSAAMTEGYAALGAAGTLPQVLYEIRALLAEKSIASTTLTAKKLDGTTTAATYTLDSDTAPTSITRAT